MKMKHDMPTKVPAPDNKNSNQPVDMKTSGVKIRGTGAATKGTLARGPMG